MNHQVYPNGMFKEKLWQAEISKKFEELAAKIPDLKQYGNAARIAVLLNRSGCKLDKMMKIIQAGVNDLWLPVTAACMHLDLDRAEFTRFDENQRSLLSDTFNIDESSKYPGHHVNLGDSALGWAQIPTVFNSPQVLGQGRFGKVIGAQYEKGEVYAIKRIQREKDFEKNRQLMKSFETELGILRRVKEGHCVRLVCSYTDWVYVGLIMEPKADYNLEDYLDGFQRGKNKDQDLATFYGCLATTLAALHITYNIRHKDIKPQNILVQDNRVLLADFGMSLDWSEFEDSKTNEERRSTSIYAAPEAIEMGKERGSNSDIWSLGCVFLEMTAVLRGKERKFVRDTLAETGSSLYWKNPQGIKNVIQSLRETNCVWGDEPLNWVEEMLKEEKDERPSARSLREKILAARGKKDFMFCCIACEDRVLVVPRKEEGQCRTNERFLTTSVSTTQNTEGTSGSRSRNITSDSHELVKIHKLRTPDSIEVKLTRDPSSPKTWISDQVVKKLGLQQRDALEAEVYTFEGVRLESRKWVTMNWVEKEADRACTREVLVATGELPFEVLMGSS